MLSWSRHPDFICIAAANTWGLGATNDYVGILKLDAAFLDRFVQIFWDVDEGLEMVTVGDTEWTKVVQGYRARIKAKGIKVINLGRVLLAQRCWLLGWRLRRLRL